MDGCPRAGAGSAGSGLTTVVPAATCLLSSAGGGAGPATNASGRLDCRPLLRGVTPSGSPLSFPPLAPAEALPPRESLSATDGGGAGPASNLRVMHDRGCAISLFVGRRRFYWGRAFRGVSWKRETASRERGGHPRGKSCARQTTRERFEEVAPGFDRESRGSENSDSRTSPAPASLSVAARRNRTSS